MSVVRCVAFVIAMSGAAAAGAPPALVELQLATSTLRGKVLAHDSRSFCLLGQDGKLHWLENAAVTQFRKVAPEFSSWSPGIVRDQLRREFGQRFEVGSTRHYLVCAKSDAAARLYAETFEELFRTFHHYFSVRGFKIADPDFPLVAIVFPDYASFAEYARADKLAVSPMLRGYYHSATNRVALYEGEPARASAEPADARVALGSPPRAEPLQAAASTAWHAIQADLRDTMIHEGTHQAAFNTGLHSRIGVTPKWVVEGLATVFESPGVRNSGSVTAKARINPERYVWFGNFQKTRRQPKSLEAFLAGDELFDREPLDAYSQAWAFTFFLIETRPRAYADYLRAIAERDPLTAYPAEARVADFKRTISREINLIEAEFLRYMSDLR